MTRTAHWTVQLLKSVLGIQMPGMRHGLKGFEIAQSVTKITGVLQANM